MIETLKKLLRHSKFFYFLFGLLLASSIYFYTENAYEKEIFEALKKYTQSNISNEYKNNIDSILVQSTHTTHILEKSRQTLFREIKGNTLKSKYLQPITYDLMTGQGACGSNAYVLGRLLTEFGITVKFAQMHVNNPNGVHIIIEAQKDTGWVALDALYNQFFIDTLGKLASFNDVSKNWDYYKTQVNKDYDLKYDYEAVQYTNWKKIPIVMPAIRKILVFFKGEQYVQSLSLRNLLLKKFSLLFNLSLYLIVIVVLKRTYNYYKIVKAN